MNERTWTLVTTYDEQSELQVLYFKWQRQAYRFALDWWGDDELLTALVLSDDNGHADTLRLQR